MGYPMTFRRFVCRNGLEDGDYGEPPGFAPVEPHPDAARVLSREELAEMLRTTTEDYRRRAMSMAGDLRRLERDLVDERALCREITRRTGLSGDDVAAVLRELATL